MKKEQLLWVRLKEGDSNAFEQLFRIYHQDLYRYGFKFCSCRQTTEDEIQNLFLKIWANKKRLGDVTAVKTYLWTALRRRLFARIKKNEKERERADRYAPAGVFHLSVEEFVIKKERLSDRRKHLEKAIGTLSPKQKEILYLKFYEGMSYEEIEEIMSVNYQVARNYLYRGLEKLRQEWPAGVPTLFS